MPQGYIYIAQREDGPIKIGYSEDPERRVQDSDMGRTRHTLLAFFPASRKVERQISQALRQYRLGYRNPGEWFEDGPWVQKLIDMLTDMTTGDKES